MEAIIYSGANAVQAFKQLEQQYKNLDDW